MILYLDTHFKNSNSGIAKACVILIRTECSHIILGKTILQGLCFNQIEFRFHLDYIVYLYELKDALCMYLYDSYFSLYIITLQVYGI